MSAAGHGHAGFRDLQHAIRPDHARAGSIKGNRPCRVVARQVLTPDSVYTIVNLFEPGQGPYVQTTNPHGNTRPQIPCIYVGTGSLLGVSPHRKYTQACASSLPTLTKTQTAPKPH